MVDQPTSASSLEEARNALEDILFRTPREVPYYDWPDEVGKCIDALLAAARAEVIREVEAVFEKYGAPDHGDCCSSIQAWNPRNRICDCGRDEALRALSQGGETDA